MTRTDEVPERDEAARLSAFGDALVAGRAPDARTEIEATMERVHIALGADQHAGFVMPVGLKHVVWEDLMMPTTPEGPRSHVGAQPTSMRERRRSLPAPSLAHLAYRWQAAVSLGLVLIVLAGLASIVTQRDGLPGDHGRRLVALASPTSSPSQNVASLPEVPARCEANGTITSNAELATKSITDWPAPLYTPVQSVSYAQGLAIQKTFLSYLRCEWNALHSATPPATPEPPVLAVPVLLTYFSDRLRYDRLYHQLSPSQQKALDAYRCRPRIKELLASFPLPVNQPLDRAKLGTAGDASSTFLPIFAPSDVYRLPDGRYGAIVGSISTAALTDPSAVTPADVLQFFAFTQTNGRFYIDEIFTLVAPNMDQITENGRNGSLSTRCQ